MLTQTEQTNKMNVYRIKLSIGVNSGIITTPWFATGDIHTTIYTCDNNGTKLLGIKNTHRSVAHFLKHWFKSERIYQDMKATNKSELKCKRHLMILNMERLNNQGNVNVLGDWISHQIPGKLKSKKIFHKKVPREVEGMLLYLHLSSMGQSMQRSGKQNCLKTKKEKLHSKVNENDRIHIVHVEGSNFNRESPS